MEEECRALEFMAFSGDLMAVTLFILGVGSFREALRLPSGEESDLPRMLLWLKGIALVFPVAFYVIWRIPGFSVASLVSIFLVFGIVSAILVFAAFGVGALMGLFGETSERLGASTARLANVLLWSAFITAGIFLSVVGISYRKKEWNSQDVSDEMWFRLGASPIFPIVIVGVCQSLCKAVKNRRREVLAMTISRLAATVESGKSAYRKWADRRMKTLPTYPLNRISRNIFK